MNPDRTTRRPFRLLAALVPAAAASMLLLLASGDPVAPTDDARALEEVLSRFSGAQASIENLKAEFEERKTLSLLKDEVVLTGTLYHSRPLNFFWDYETPSPKQILLTSEVLLAYYPELNKAEEVNVRRWNQRIKRYLQLGLDVDALRKDYDIALGTTVEGDPERTDLLVLTPTKRRKRSRLEEIRVWCDQETGHTRRIRYLEQGGDVTTFTFHNVHVNEGVPETVYNIELPDDVRMGDTFTGFAGG